MSLDEQEGVLSRWSRRKRQTQEQNRSEDILHESIDSSQAAIEVSRSDGEDNAEAVEAPVLTDEDMPPIESLDENSDFSLFMSSGVSDKLRNLALKKMFHTPAFNIRDGLDEYDEDYTYFEKLGDIVTCDMKHQIEMQEQKKREEAEARAAQELDELEDEDPDSLETLSAEDEIERTDSGRSEPENLDTGFSEATDGPEVNETRYHE